MHHLKYISVCSVLLLLSHNVYAQRTEPSDTLRRRLTVMTSETIKLGERQPSALRLDMTQRPALTPAKLEIGRLPILHDALQPSQLLGLDSLAPVPKSKPQLGYASVGIGLPTGLQISAGIRPINTERRSLDVHLSGKWSRYNHEISPRHTQSLQGQALRLGIGYRELMRSLQYKLYGSLYTDKYTAQGLVYTPISWGSPIQHWWEAQTKEPSLSSTLIRLGGELSSLPQDLIWRYQIKPQLAFARRGADRDTYMDISGALGRSFGNSSVDINADVVAWHSAPTHRNSYLLGFFSIAPSWSKELRSDTFGWHVRLGAKIAVGSRDTVSNSFLLAPNISAGITLRDWLHTKIVLDGGINGRSLGDVILESPYLRVGSPIGLTHTPIRSSLSVDMLPLANLSVSLLARYERLLNAEGTGAEALVPMTRPDFEAMLTRGRFEQGTRSYLVNRHYRYHLNAHHWQLGGAVIYRAKHWLEAELSAYYHQWRTDNQENYLGGYPNLDLLAKVDFTPNELYRLSFGYRILGRYKYPVRISLQDEMYSTVIAEDFGLTSQLMASASYRLTDRIGFFAGAHFYITPLQGKFIGYPEPRLFIKGGVNIKF